LNGAGAAQLSQRPSERERSVYRESGLNAAISYRKKERRLRGNRKRATEEEKSTSTLEEKVAMLRGKKSKAATFRAGVQSSEEHYSSPKSLRGARRRARSRLWKKRACVVHFDKKGII